MMHRDQWVKRWQLAGDVLHWASQGALLVALAGYVVTDSWVWWLGCMSASFLLRVPYTLVHEHIMRVLAAEIAQLEAQLQAYINALDGRDR